MILYKTLPNLVDLFVNKEFITLFSTELSYNIYQAFSNLHNLNLTDVKFSRLVKLLAGLKYQKVLDISTPCEYTVRGDIIFIWPIGYSNPVKLEFFGEDLEKSFTFDSFTKQKIEKISKLILLDNNLLTDLEKDKINIRFPENSELESFIISKANFSEKMYAFTKIIDTGFTLPSLLYSRQDLLDLEIKRLKNIGYQCIIKTKYNEMLQNYPKIIDVDAVDNEAKFFIKNLNKILSISSGFISAKYKIAVFTDREIFGTLSREFISVDQKDAPKTLELFNINRLIKQMESEIELGDFVVHIDYGIALYNGITQEEVNGSLREFIELKFDKGDKLLLPIEQVFKISKYIGQEGANPTLSKLGRGSWQKTKEKVLKATTLIAKELLKHYATLKISTAKKLKLEESSSYIEFVKQFPYKETQDQNRAIAEIMQDISKGVPMNRLLVGDVGFGKTEVFLRAAFRIIENGGQVAILAPTTILTAQHYAVIKERFKEFPISVAYVSRFNSPKENRAIIDKLSTGKIDIVVGTHRLLSSDVKFKSLELLVIDEEQRFGVKQKEKIKQINYGAHLLNVSATPIPRTLGMALSALQQISIITEPPKERMSINTELSGRDLNKILQYIERELNRNGQTYIIHNEISTINAFKTQLENLSPGIKYVVAHGKMRPAELDRIMTDFFEKKYDCLIATTIIENGIDLPNVNTIIIDNAEKFGLSQLYQLRGRVGRSNKQAFCLLIHGQSGKKVFPILENEKLKEKLIKKKTKSIERIQSLLENQDLGAGFRISSRDLEIRGAGNLLGEEQSGHIYNIGFSLYMEMLSKEIIALKKGTVLSKAIL